MIGASSCGICFNLLQPKPLFAPACWGVFFIMGHAIQITRILRAKAHVSLSAEDHHLYEHGFMPFGFSPRQFLDLMQTVPPARVRTPCGENLVAQGDPVLSVGYVVAGSFSVECDGEVVNKTQSGTWAGEFWDPAYKPLESRTWPVAYRAQTRDCETVVWPKGELQAYLEAHRSQLEVSSDRIQLADLASKLDGSRKSHLVALYEHLVAMATADGVVDSKERAIVASYRALHSRFVGESEHNSALAKAGWAAEDFERGHRPAACGRPLGASTAQAIQK